MILFMYCGHFILIRKHLVKAFKAFTQDVKMTNMPWSGLNYVTFYPLNCVYLFIIDTYFGNSINMIFQLTSVLRFFFTFVELYFNRIKECWGSVTIK